MIFFYTFCDVIGMRSEIENHTVQGKCAIISRFDFNFLTFLMNEISITWNNVTWHIWKQKVETFRHIKAGQDTYQKHKFFYIFLFEKTKLSSMRKKDVLNVKFLDEITRNEIM